MKVQGTHVADAGLAALWAALEDPAALSQTLPGLQRLEVLGADEYGVTLEVGVGAIKGTYDGTFAVTDKVDGESCTVRASARGSQGSVQAVARVQLSEAAGGGSRIAYEADTTLTGPIAGVGQRMLGAAAKRTTKDFLSAVDAYVARTAADGSAPAAMAGAPEPGMRATAPGKDPSGPGAPSGAAPHSSAATGAVFAGRPPASAGIDRTSLLLGFALALIGAAAGRWLLP